MLNMSGWMNNWMCFWEMTNQQRTQRLLREGRDALRRDGNYDPHPEMPNRSKIGVSTGILAQHQVKGESV
jgi:hypothetical protein